MINDSRRIEKLPGLVRTDILKAALSTGKVGAHIASSLSIVEIVISIFGCMNIETDSFILSKGHGALGYYAVLHQLQLISDEQFQSFEHNGGDFPGQPSRSKENRIEYSSGSLGMGLSYAVGVALSKKKKDGKIYVVLGDGELDEGSVWEAVALSSYLKLDNLVAIVDVNGLQSEGKTSEILNQDFKSIWKAHKWNTIVCDGHSQLELRKSLGSLENEKPTVVLANTVKGKGISFMENNNEWHHHTLNEEQYNVAMKELSEQYGLY